MTSFAIILYGQCGDSHVVGQQQQVVSDIGVIRSCLNNYSVPVVERSIAISLSVCLRVYVSVCVSVCPREYLWNCRSMRSACLSVCVSVCPRAYVWKRWTGLHEFMCRSSDSGLVLLWRRCDTLCTSGWMTSRLAVVGRMAMRCDTGVKSDVYECLVSI